VTRLTGPAGQEITDVEAVSQRAWTAEWGNCTVTGSRR